MKNYQIEIIERLRKVINVNADSIKSAEAIVKDLYDKKEIILSHDDLLFTEINSEFNKNFEKFREKIISEYVKETRKLHSERIKISKQLKKQRLDNDVEKKYQEIER